MSKYMDLIFIQVNIFQFEVSNTMIFLDSNIYSTFGFEDVPSKDLNNLSDGYTDIFQKDTCYDWCNYEPPISKKKHLLREERDPNLAESRLDFDFSNSTPSNETVGLTKARGDICKHDALSNEDKKLYTDRILKPDKDGDNLLFMAIITNQTHLSILLIDLISHHTRLKVYNKLYQTALHLAVLSKNAKITRRLVIAGINIEFRDRLGNTALHIACTQGSLDVVEALVTAVSYKETQLNTYTIPYQPIPQNLDIRNSEGLSCLHLAVINKHKDIVAFLLSKEANVDVIEMKAGKTCLHFAAESGSEKIVEVILSKSRPNLSAKTFTGYTATELAHYRGHDHIVYLLRCKGALAARPIVKIETPELDDDFDINDINTVGVDDDYDEYSDTDYKSEDDDCVLIE